MRYILWFWALPLALFWGWYGLASNDINMGTTFFSRQVHDQVFSIYSAVLQIPAEQIPALAAKACVFDTFIVFGLLAIRHYKSWLPNLLLKARELSPIAR